MENALWYLVMSAATYGVFLSLHYWHPEGEPFVFAAWISMLYTEILTIKSRLETVETAMKKFEPELGQIAFGDATLPFDGRWMSDGVTEIARAVARARRDPYSLASNAGMREFDCPIFTMRAYCWCDGCAPGHEDECPPNFVHKPSGLTIRWYKHGRRSVSANDVPSVEDWQRIVTECVAAAVAAEVS